MRYCPRCQHLTKDELCPFCKNRNLREVDDADPVWLVTADSMDCDRLMAVLEDTGIPYEERINKLEISPSAYFGRNAQTQKDIFVPYGSLSQCKEILMGIGIPVKEEEQKKTSQKNEDFQEMKPAARFFWRIFSALLFILLVWAVVALTDGFTSAIINFFKG